MKDDHIQNVEKAVISSGVTSTHPLHRLSWKMTTYRTSRKQWSQVVLLLHILYTVYHERWPHTERRESSDLQWCYFYTSLSNTTGDHCLLDVLYVIIFHDNLCKGCVEVTPLEITAFSTWCYFYTSFTQFIMKDDYIQNVEKAVISSGVTSTHPLHSLSWKMTTYRK
jgi:hypothetical protein